MPADEVVSALERAVLAAGLLPPDEVPAAARRLAVLWSRFVGGETPPFVWEPVPEISGRLVRLDGIVVHTLCPHHLVPARTLVTVTYWPVTRVAGFGALGRLADWHTRRPVLHEQYVQRLAGDLAERLGCKVSVEARASHVCATASGEPAPAEVVVVATAS